MRNKSKFLKILSLIVAGIFLHQQILWAAGDVSNPGRVVSGPRAVSYDDTCKGIRVSNELAQTDGIHLNGSKDIIINIQDCHSSLSSQYSIVNVLKDLLENYNLKVIAIEGGSGYIDTSILRSFPDAEIKGKTAAYLMKEGKISAGEFFSVTTDEDIALYGVEDNSLYRENLRIFRDIYAKNRDNIAELSSIRDNLKNRETEMYSRKLNRMVFKSRLHREGKISFDIYWEFLEKICGETDISTGEYSNVKSFTDSIRLEKSIDFNRATSERKELIGELMEKASREDLEKMVVKSLAFEKGKIDQSGYHKWLLIFAAERGVQTNKFPELCKFTDYAGNYRNLDVIGLQREIDQLESKVLEKLFSSQKERRLYRLVRTVELLKSLFEIKLTGEDVSYLAENIDGVTGKEFACFIGGGEGGASGDTISRTCENLEKVISEAKETLKFYELAEKRNHAMLANTVSAMKREGKHVAALISGGHHSRGLTEIMEKKGLSYLVLMPKFLSDESRPYVAVLTKKAGPYRELVSSGAYDLALEAYFDTGDLEALEEMLAFAAGQSVLAGKDVVTEIKEWADHYSENYGNLSPTRREAMDAEPVKPEDLEKRLKKIEIVNKDGNSCEVRINGNIYRVTAEEVEAIQLERKGAKKMIRKYPARVFKTLQSIFKGSEAARQRLLDTGTLNAVSKIGSAGRMTRDIVSILTAGAGMGLSNIVGGLALAWAARSLTRVEESAAPAIDTNVIAGALRREVEKGLRNIDRSVYNLDFEEQRDVREVETPPIPELGINSLLLKIYHNEERVRYDVTGEKKLESVTEPHPESCKFCHLPEKEVIKINGNRTILVNDRPYEIAVNINPYFEDHINLFAGMPEAQYLTREKIEDLLTFQKALGSVFSGHYNGINAGATVLHFHGQFRKTVMPFWGNLKKGRISIVDKRVEDGVTVGRAEGWPGNLEVFESGDIKKLSRRIWQEVAPLLDNNVGHNFEWIMEEDGVIRVALDWAGSSEFRNLNAEDPYQIKYGAVEKSGYIKVNDIRTIELLRTDRDKCLTRILKDMDNISRKAQEPAKRLRRRELPVIARGAAETGNRKEDSPDAGYEENIIRILSAQPLTGEQLLEKLSVNSIAGAVKVWQICRNSSKIKIIFTGVKYLRVDTDSEGNILPLVSPGILREFHSYSAIGLKDDEYVSVLAGKLANKRKSVNKRKQSLALDILLHFGIPSENICFLLSGDLSIGMGHDEVRPHPVSGQDSRGSGIDIVVIYDEEKISEQKLSSIRQNMFFAEDILPRDERTEVDLTVISLQAIREFSGDNHRNLMTAKNLVFTARHLGGDVEIWNAARKSIKEAGIEARLQELEKEALSTREEKEGKLRHKPYPQWSEKDRRIFMGGAFESFGFHPPVSDPDTMNLGSVNSYDEKTHLDLRARLEYAKQTQVWGEPIKDVTFDGEYRAKVSELVPDLPEDLHIILIEHKRAPPDSIDEKFLFFDPITKKWVFSHSGTRSQTGKFIYLTKKSFNDLSQTDEGRKFLRKLIWYEYEKATAKLEDRWTEDHDKKKAAFLRAFIEEYLRSVVFQTTNPSKHPQVIVSAGSNKPLREHVSELLNVKSAEILTGRFPDGEIKAVVKDPGEIKGENCMIVQDIGSDEDFVSLLLIIAGLRDAGAKKVSCVLPEKMLKNNILLDAVSSFADIYTADNFKFPTTFTPYRPEKPEPAGYKERKKSEKTCLLFTRDYRKLKQKVADGLVKAGTEHDMEIGHVKTRTLEEGRASVRVSRDTKGKNCLLIHNTRTAKGLVELLIILEKLKRQGAGKIECLIYFLGYDRQHENYNVKEYGENAFSVNSAKFILELINRYCKRIYTVNTHFIKEPSKEPHSFPEIEGLEIVNLSAFEYLARYYKEKYGLEKAALVGGDDGVAGFLPMVAEKMGWELHYPIKHRISVKVCDFKIPDEWKLPENGGKGVLKGKDVVLLDDVVSGGSTLVKLAIMLKNDFGVRRVFAGTAHGKQSNKNLAYFRSLKDDSGRPVFDDIIATDTVVSPTSKVSIAELIVEFLKAQMEYEEKPAIDLILPRRLAGYGDFMFALNIARKLKSMHPRLPVKVIFFRDRDYRELDKIKPVPGFDSSKPSQTSGGITYINAGDSREKVNELVGERDLAIIFGVCHGEYIKGGERESFSRLAREAASRIMIYDMGQGVRWLKPNTTGDYSLGFNKDSLGLPPPSPAFEGYVKRRAGRSREWVRKERKRVLGKMPWHGSLDKDAVAGSRWGFVYTHYDYNVKKYLKALMRAREISGGFSAEPVTIFAVHGRNDKKVREEALKAADENGYSVFEYSHEKKKLVALRTAPGKVTIIMNSDVPGTLFEELFVLSDDLPSLISGSNNLSSMMFMCGKTSGRAYFWEAIATQLSAGADLDRFAKEVLTSEEYEMFREQQEPVRSADYDLLARLFIDHSAYRPLFRKLAVEVDNKFNFKKRIAAAMGAWKEKIDKPRAGPSPEDGIKLGFLGTQALFDPAGYRPLIHAVAESLSWLKAKIALARESISRWLFLRIRGAIADLRGTIADLTYRSFLTPMPQLIPSVLSFIPAFLSVNILFGGMFFFGGVSRAEDDDLSVIKDKFAGKLVVVALGGNAFIKDGKDSDREQRETIRRIVKEAAKLIEAGANVIITHGNGPQAGMFARETELRMDSIQGASQGWLGSMIELALRNELRKKGIDKDVAGIVTFVEVEKDDPGIVNPTKPIGSFFTEENAKKEMAEHQWQGIIEEPGKSGKKGQDWRRAIGSPLLPFRVIQAPQILEIAKKGKIVIAAGGGGIAVTKNNDGEYVGVDVVPDKDRASGFLAREINADYLIILTDQESVYRDFGKQGQEPIKEMTVGQAERYMEDGQFGRGNMLPKVEAAVNFVRSGGSAVITDGEHLIPTLKGKSGTVIVPDPLSQPSSGRGGSRLLDLVIWPIIFGAVTFAGTFFGALASLFAGDGFAGAGSILPSGFLSFIGEIPGLSIFILLGTVLSVSFLGKGSSKGDGEKVLAEFKCSKVYKGDGSNHVIYREHQIGKTLGRLLSLKERSVFDEMVSDLLLNPHVERIVLKENAGFIADLRKNETGWIMEIDRFALGHPLLARYSREHEEYLSHIDIDADKSLITEIYGKNYTQEQKETLQALMRETMAWLLSLVRQSRDPNYLAYLKESSHPVLKDHTELLERAGVVNIREEEDGRTVKLVVDHILGSSEEDNVKKLCAYLRSDEENLKLFCTVMRDVFNATEFNIALCMNMPRYNRMREKVYEDGTAEFKAIPLVKVSGAKRKPADEIIAGLLVLLPELEDDSIFPVVEQAMGLMNPDCRGFVKELLTQARTMKHLTAGKDPIFRKACCRIRWYTETFLRLILIVLSRTYEDRQKREDSLKDLFELKATVEKVLEERRLPGEEEIALEEEKGIDVLHSLLLILDLQAGCLYLTLNEPEKAIAVMEPCLKEELTDADKHSFMVFIAKSYAALKDFEKAIDYCKGALDIHKEISDEEAKDLHMEIGAYYMEQEKFDEAKETLLKALELAGESDKIVFNRPAHFTGKDNYTRTILGMICNNLASCFARENRGAEGMHYINKAVCYAPGEPVHSRTFLRFLLFYTEVDSVLEGLISQIKHHLKIAPEDSVLYHMIFRGCRGNPTILRSILKVLLDDEAVRRAGARPYIVQEKLSDTVYELYGDGENKKYKAEAIGVIRRILRTNRNKTVHKNANTLLERLGVGPGVYVFIDAAGKIPSLIRKESPRKKFRPQKEVAPLTDMLNKITPGDLGLQERRDIVTCLEKIINNEKLRKRADNKEHWRELLEAAETRITDMLEGVDTRNLSVKACRDMTDFLENVAANEKTRLLARGSNNKRLDTFIYAVKTKLKELGFQRHVAEYAGHWPGVPREFISSVLTGVQIRETMLTSKRARKLIGRELTAGVLKIKFGRLESVLLELNDRAVRGISSRIAADPAGIRDEQELDRKIIDALFILFGRFLKEKGRKWILETDIWKDTDPVKKIVRQHLFEEKDVNAAMNGIFNLIAEGLIEKDKRYGRTDREKLVNAISRVRGRIGASDLEDTLFHYFDEESKEAVSPKEEWKKIAAEYLSTFQPALSELVGEKRVTDIVEAVGRDEYGWTKEMKEGDDIEEELTASLLMALIGEWIEDDDESFPEGKLREDWDDAVLEAKEAVEECLKSGDMQRARGIILDTVLEPETREPEPQPVEPELPPAKPEPLQVEPKLPRQIKPLEEQPREVVTADSREEIIERTVSDYLEKYPGWKEVFHLSISDVAARIIKGRDLDKHRDMNEREIMARTARKFIGNYFREKGAEYVFECEYWDMLRHDHEEAIALFEETLTADEPAAALEKGVLIRVAPLYLSRFQPALDELVAGEDILSELVGNVVEKRYGPEKGNAPREDAGEAIIRNLVILVIIEYVKKNFSREKLQDNWEKNIFIAREDIESSLIYGYARITREVISKEVSVSTDVGGPGNIYSFLPLALLPFTGIMPGLSALILLTTILFVLFAPDFGFGKKEYDSRYAEGRLHHALYRKNTKERAAAARTFFKNTVEGHRVLFVDYLTARSLEDVLAIMFSLLWGRETVKRVAFGRVFIKGIRKKEVIDYFKKKKLLSIVPSSKVYLVNKFHHWFKIRKAEEAVLKRFKKGRIKWAEATKVAKRCLVRLLAKELGKRPGELNTQDFGKRLKVFGNRSLSGLLRSYVGPRRPSGKGAHIKGLKALKKDLGIKDILAQIITKKNILRMVKRGYVRWSNTTKKARFRLVKFIARELGKKPGELTTADFGKPFKVLNGKYLSGLLEFYQRINKLSGEEGAGAKALKALKKDLGIRDIAVEVITEKTVLQKLRWGRIDWAKTTRKARCHLVELLARKCRKKPVELTPEDFKKSSRIFGDTNLIGLLEFYIKKKFITGKDPYNKALKVLKNELRIKEESGEVTEKTILERFRRGNVKWADATKKAREYLVNILAGELGKKPGELIVSDFGKEIAAFNNKRLIGFLEFYMRTHDLSGEGSTLKALQALKADLGIKDFMGFKVSGPVIKPGTEKEKRGLAGGQAEDPDRMLQEYIKRGKVIEYVRDESTEKWLAHRLKYIKSRKWRVRGTSKERVRNPERDLNAEQNKILNNVLKSQFKKLKLFDDRMPSFCVILGKTVIGWGGLEKCSILHTGYRRKRIWIGEHLFKDFLQPKSGQRAAALREELKHIKYRHYTDSYDFEYRGLLERVLEYARKVDKLVRALTVGKLKSGKGHITGGELFASIKVHVEYGDLEEALKLAKILKKISGGDYHAKEIVREISSFVDWTKTKEPELKAARRKRDKNRGKLSRAELRELSSKIRKLENRRRGIKKVKKSLDSSFDGLRLSLPGRIPLEGMFSAGTFAAVIFSAGSGMSISFIWLLVSAITILALMAWTKFAEDSPSLILPSAPDPRIREFISFCEKNPEAILNKVEELRNYFYSLSPEAQEKFTRDLMSAVPEEKIEPALPEKDDNAPAVLAVALGSALDVTLHYGPKGVYSTVAPGGKPINGARAFRKWGTEVFIYAFTGKSGTGGRFKDEVGKCCKNSRFYEHEGDTRVTVVLSSDPKEMKIGVYKNKNISVSKSIVEKFLKDLDAYLHKNKSKIGFIVTGGSFPEGTPEDIYARIINIAKKHDVGIAADFSYALSREAFESILAAGPTVIKPNFNELCLILSAGEIPVGVAPEAVSKATEKVKKELKGNYKLIAEKTREILIERDILMALVSLGEEGAILVTRDKGLMVKPPVIKKKSSVGSGDTFLAGCVRAFLEDPSDLEGILTFGTAAAAGYVSKPGSRIPSLSEIGRIMPGVEKEILFSDETFSSTSDKKNAHRIPDDEIIPGKGSVDWRVMFGAAGIAAAGIFTWAHGGVWLGGTLAAIGIGVLICGVVRILTSRVRLITREKTASKVLARFEEIGVKLIGEGNEPILVSDLDGTITESNLPVSRASLDAIIEILKTGSSFVLLTGISKKRVDGQFLKPLLDVLPAENREILKHLIIATDNGTQIYQFDEGMNDYKCINAEDIQSRIKPDKYERIFKIIDLCAARCGMRQMLKETMGWQFSDEEWEAYKKECIDLREVNGIVTQISFMVLKKTATHEEKKKFDEKSGEEIRRRYEEYILKAFHDEGIKLGAKVSGLSSIDITLIGINKAFGIEAVSKLFDQPTDNMIFFGDSFLPGDNDEPVLGCVNNVVNVGSNIDPSKSRYYKGDIEVLQLPDTGPEGFRLFTGFFSKRFQRFTLPGFGAVYTGELAEDMLDDMVSAISKKSTELTVQQKLKIERALAYLIAMVNRNTEISGGIRKRIRQEAEKLSRRSFWEKARCYPMRAGQVSDLNMLHAFVKDDRSYFIEDFLNEDELSREENIAGVILYQIFLKLRSEGLMIEDMLPDDRAEIDGVFDIQDKILRKHMAFSDTLRRYTLKAFIRTTMEDDVFGRDLVKYQGSEGKNIRIAGRNVKDFIDTIYTIMQTEGKMFNNREDMARYLTKRFGVRKFILAGGKGMRFSPDGVVVKQLFKPDGYNTAIKQSRKSAAFGKLEDVIIIDPVTFFHILKEDREISGEIKRRMRFRLKIVFERLVNSGIIEADKSDVLFAAIDGIIERDMVYTRRPDGLRDLAMVMHRVDEKIDNVMGKEFPMGQFVVDKVSYAFSRELVTEKSYIDEEKKDELFGENCIVVLDSGEGHGSAYMEALEVLKHMGKLRDARYSVIVYADMPGWGLDKYSNAAFISYLKAVNLISPATRELPRVTIAAKSANSVDGRATGRARILVKKTEKFRDIPIAIKEWNNMTSKERLESQNMAEVRDPAWLTNAKILICDTEWISEWMDKNENVFWSEYRHELREQSMRKRRPYEYVSSDLLNIAAKEYMEKVALTSRFQGYPDVPPLTRLVYMGRSAPSANKTLQRVIDYRDNLQSEIIEKIRKLGIDVDTGATVAISGNDAGPEYDLDRVIYDIFGDNLSKVPGLGNTKIKGSIRLDAAVRIRKGAILDGTKKCISLTGDCVVERGVKLDGVAADNELFAENVIYEAVKFYVITGFPLKDSSTIEATPVDDVDFSKLGLIADASTRIWLVKKNEKEDNLAIFKKIFGNDRYDKRVIDQIFLYGDIVLDETVRVENGTMLDGRGDKEVVLLGRTQVQKGVSVKGVKASDTVFTGKKHLDPYHYSQPTYDEIVFLNSVFANSCVEYPGKVENSMVTNSYITSGAQIIESDVTDEVVVGDEKIIGRRLSARNDLLSASIKEGKDGKCEYIPGAYRLEEKMPRDREEIKKYQLSYAEELYKRFIKDELILSRMMEDTKRFMDSGVIDRFTLQQIRQYMIAKVRENIKPDLESFQPLVGDLRAYAGTFMEDVLEVDIKDEAQAKKLFQRLAILATRVNIVDFSMDPRIFDPEYIYATIKGGKQKFNKLFNEMTESKLGINGFVQFEEMIFGPRKGTFLYFTDNIGETEFDALLWEFLVRMGHTVVIAPKDEFSFADINVKGVNEIIGEYPSLKAHRKSGRIRVIKSGSSSEGLFPHKFGEEIRTILRDKDFIAIVAKGQENLFTLSARNNMRVPVVAMLLSKSSASDMVTGVPPKRIGDKKVLWPIIAVIPPGEHAFEKKRDGSVSTLRRFGKVSTKIKQAKKFGFEIAVGLPSVIYDRLDRADMIGRLRDIPGISAIIRVDSSGREESMLRELDGQTRGARCVSVLVDASVIDIGAPEAAIVGELKETISDFAEKIQTEIIKLTNPEITKLTKKEIKAIKDINDIKKIMRILLRAQPYSRSYRLSEKSVRQMRVRNAFNAFYVAEVEKTSRIEYLEKTIQNSDRHYLVHYADGQEIISGTGSIIIPPGFEIQKRREAQDISRSMDVYHDKFFIVAPKGVVTHKEKEDFKIKIMALWMLDGVISDKDVIILDRTDKGYRTSGLYAVLSEHNGEATKANTGFRCLNGHLEYDGAARASNLLQVDLAENAKNNINQYEVFVNLLISREEGDENYLAPNLTRDKRGFYVYLPDAEVVDLEYEIRKYYDKYVKEVMVKA